MLLLKWNWSRVFLNTILVHHGPCHIKNRILVYYNKIIIYSNQVHHRNNTCVKQNNNEMLLDFTLKQSFIDNISWVQNVAYAIWKHKCNWLGENSAPSSVYKRKGDKHFEQYISLEKDAWNTITLRTLSEELN